MFFLVILALTVLAIASAAAFFSIYGLAQIYSGAFWPVVIMASTLEVGKLVAASYVYRYWKSITVTMKTYLISAILVLMLLTSAGVFGFLTAAHQQGIIGLTEIDTKVQLLEQEKQQAEQLKSERLARRQQIDDDIANLPSNFVTARQRLAVQFQNERNKIESDIERYTAIIESKTKEISDLKLSKIQQESHVGPILYIAKALNRGVEEAVIWMTYLIVFAFDPLAVVLTIGFNIALFRHKKEKLSLVTNDDTLTDDEPKPTIISADQLVDEDVDESLDDILKQLDEEVEEPEELSTVEKPKSVAPAIVPKAHIPLVRPRPAKRYIKR